MPKVGELWAEIGARTDKLDRALKDSESKFDRFSRNVGRIGNTLTVGVTLPLLAVGKSAVKAASDAEETRSKFQAVFKDLSAGVQGWAKIHAASIGRSSEDWLGYLAAVQDTLVPLGFARKEAADMSKQVVTLAEDLASFNNLNTADVVQRLTSALVGNVENLRQFGVVANEAQIKTEAFRSGMIKSTKDAITPQQKALAILNLTMAGTSDAQGDAARTSGSFANKTRGLEASFKDLRIAMGERLLPTLSSFVDGLKGFVDQLNRMDEGKLDKLAAFFVALAAAGPALKIFSKVGIGGLALGGFGVAMTEAELNKNKSGAVGVFATWFADGLFAAIRKVRDSGESIFSKQDLNLLAKIDPSMLLSSHGGGRSTTTSFASAPAPGVSNAARLFAAGFRGVQDITPRPKEAYPQNFKKFPNEPTKFELRPLGELTDGMKKAADGMARVGQDTNAASVRMAEFGAIMKDFEAGAFRDFTNSIADAVVGLVVFGDSLKDTLRNLAQNVGSSLLGGLVSIGTTFALSSIPGVGQLLGFTDSLLNKSGGGGAYQGLIKHPDTAVGSRLSARVSLGSLVIEEQRTATRNNLNLVGLG